MSKSNLRKPKSFNFGFPADDDSDASSSEEQIPDDPKPSMKQPAK